ncbi:MAG: TIGR03761 family integrating conjugative element protein [Hydrogenophaga sp.]|nr:TIGR03761 family integrating conjugative element protein [Hydrogenophaga sp.]
MATTTTSPSTGKKAGKGAAAATAPLASSTVFIPAAKSMMFETEPNSPFSDGYSIAREREVLADFLADPSRQHDENDPLYDRHIELIDREDQLDRMKAQYQSSKGADPLVEHKEAVAMNFLGSLVDDGVDQMALHTKEAFRMFMGRSRDPEKKLEPIIGGKRVAAALRALWVLTGNDNPYADWGLLRHEQTIKEVGKLLAKHIADAQAALDQQKARGLTFSVLQSSSPQVLNLGFKSPYGYAVAQLVTDFDFFVRLQKTLERKNLRSDAQVRQIITETTRVIRRVFNETARFDRWLMREEMKGLCRADFVPDGDPEGAKRVQFAAEVFGPCPAEVYSGKLQPRHSRRRIQISQAERKLLQVVSDEMLRREREADAGALDEAAAQEIAAKLV